MVYRQDGSVRLTARDYTALAAIVVGNLVGMFGIYARVESRLSVLESKMTWFDEFAKEVRQDERDRIRRGN